MFSPARVTSVKSKKVDGETEEVSEHVLLGENKSAPDLNLSVFLNFIFAILLKI